MGSGDDSAKKKMKKHLDFSGINVLDILDIRCL